MLEHVTRRYQLDLREFTPDRYAFQKTLRVQMKRRSNGGEEAAEPTVPAGEQEAADAASAEVTAAQLDSIIAELTRQLDNMGPVNLDAIQEYDELEERHASSKSRTTTSPPRAKSCST